MIFDKIFEDAFYFHGHKCWASAVGVKAGLMALKVLGVERAKNADDLHCILEIGDNHSPSALPTAYNLQPDAL